MMAGFAAVGVVAGAAISSYLLTCIVWRHALQRGMLDVPNARSSHTVATPRGGGLAIVLTVLACAALLLVFQVADPRQTVAWFLGGGMVAIVGLIDDRRGVSVPVRLVVHVGAAVLLVWSAAGIAPLPWFNGTLDFDYLGLGLMAIAVVWSINLFNFMDGIDGLAASQAVFVAGAAATLASQSAAASPHTLVAMVTAAAAAGFLGWNWPPARIFMGDVGSGFLGFMLAACMFLSMHEGSLSGWTWLTLHGAFLVDATATLLIRLARGERVYDAHRTHAYQRLAMRWGSHRPVTLLFWAVNMGWLLPIAALTTTRPGAGPLLTLLALTPLVVGVILAGAGRTESEPDSTVA